MATLDPLHAIQSAIIEALAEQHPLSMRELHQRLRAHFHVSVSPQNLYRTISMLLTAQVLVREAGNLSLNRIWVSHAVLFGDRLKLSYFSDRSHSSKFPAAANQRREFKAGSLMQLDPLWTDVLVELSEHTKTRDLFAYNSRPWYSIGMRDTEQRVMEGLVGRGARIFMVYGNESYLDQYGRRQVEFSGFHSTCTANHDFPKDGYALWVGGPYVIEVTFPTLIARQFKFFFDRVSSIEQLDIELFSNLFKLKARCSLQISHDAQRAKALKRKLARHFSEA